MKAFVIEDFAALIGIDWADKKHDICENPINSNQLNLSIIPTTPKAIHRWAKELAARYPKQLIAVGCELKKGPLIYALSKYKHIVLFPINPSSVAKYRKAFSHSGAKDDPTDAAIQVEILRLHMSKLRAIAPEKEKVRELAQLVEYRRKLVQDRVNLSNKITATLKNYYPQSIDWFKEKDTVVFCDFISRWPSLADVKKARKQTLLDFFNLHNCRYPDVNVQRCKEIKEAVPLTDDQAIIKPNKLLIECFIVQFKQLIESIERFDIEIKGIYKRQADRSLFSSFPGAGPQLAPRLLVAFGSHRSRFEHASEMQKYAGISPVTERSGKKEWIHWRYSCSKFIRQTFVEWAGLSVRYSFWAKAYYKQQESRGKPHNTIIRSLAFKWIRIAFKCWKTRTPYDETRYLEALKKRGSPLLKFAAQY